LQRRRPATAVIRLSDLGIAEVFGQANQDPACRGERPLPDGRNVLPRMLRHFFAARPAG